MNELMQEEQIIPDVEEEIPFSSGEIDRTSKFPEDVVEEVSQGFFAQKEEGPRFLTDSAPVADRAQRGQITNKDRKEDLQITTGLDEAEVEMLVDSEGNLYGDIEERKVEKATGAGLLEALVDRGATLEELEAGVDKKYEIEKALESIQELTSVDAALAKDPEASGALFRIEHRKGVATNIFLDKAEEFEKGWAGTVVEFIDQMAYDTWAGVRDIKQGWQGEGTEMSTISEMWEVALRSYSDEEFKTFVDERLEHVSSAAIPGVKPSWRVLREVAAMEAAGAVLWDSEMGVLSSVFGAVDVASLGMFGATKIGKVGKTAVGRLKSTAGTRVATEAAEGTSIVKGASEGAAVAPLPTGEGRIYRADGAIIENGTWKRYTTREALSDADYLDDLVPSTQRSRVTLHAEAPPVSSGGIAQAITRNMFVRRFLSRQNTYSMGTMDLNVTGAQWAATQAARMAKASGTNVIDHHIVTEGIQQAKATFTFGKTDATPFQTKGSALQIAKGIPNSEVVAVKGKDGTEYVVKAEMRVPIKDTVEATDLAGVTNRTLIGRMFGRADIGSDSTMSNLADMADYGFKGFEQDFKKTMKGIRKIGSKELNKVDEILTSLRDTPNGGTARSWLSADEFVDTYRQMHGELPSKKVVQAYEDIVEISDFNWYVKANERLTTMANQKVTMVQVGDFAAPAFPSTQSVGSLKALDGPVWVWDAARGQRVGVKALKDDAHILELSTPLADHSTHVVNFYGRTRTPELTDALPYNAGGPRTNKEMSWFVGNNDGSWATLIGAKSEKEAARGAQQFNNIAAEVNRVLGKNVDAVVGLSKSIRDEMDKVVRANNEWNPNIEGITDFIQFAKERGVPAFSRVQHRERGTKISEILHTNDQSLINLDLDSFISYHRHDQALLEFGGKKASNPNPIIAIQRQYSQMASRAAITQYRMNHPTAWVKAVERAVEDGMPAPRQGVGPMTDEMRVKTMRIEGNTEAARKLRQEQSVINRRLENFAGSESAYPSTLR